MKFRSFGDSTSSRVKDKLTAVLKLNLASEMDGLSPMLVQQLSYSLLVADAAVGPYTSFNINITFAP